MENRLEVASKAINKNVLARGLEVARPIVQPARLNK